MFLNNICLQYIAKQKVTHRLSRWFFTSGCNPNGASERLKGV